MTGIKCTIKLESHQSMAGERETSIEEYEGSFASRNDKKYLTYKRITEDGQVNCLITFDRKSFSLTQKGAIDSKLLIVPGQETHNTYGTPMGTLELKIYARRYQIVETKDQVKIFLDYDIVTGDEPIETTMDITVTFG